VVQGWSSLRRCQKWQLGFPIRWGSTGTDTFCPMLLKRLIGRYSGTNRKTIYTSYITTPSTVLWKRCRPVGEDERNSMSRLQHPCTARSWKYLKNILLQTLCILDRKAKA
jgi:hypothetical protein